MLAKKKEETTVTMTPDELAAFVDARIAEDRSRREPTVPVPAPVFDTPIPPGPEPMSAELAAAFQAAFDGAKGDVNVAVQALLNRVQVDLHGRPSDPHFLSIFRDWTWIRDAQLAPVYWPGLIQNVMLRIKYMREYDPELTDRAAMVRQIAKIQEERAAFEEASQAWWKSRS